MTGVAPLTAPTGTKGYVDPFALGGQFTSLYLDLLEHIPDLTFPLSIPVYAKMRKDPKLAAIEAGWTLNLLRAQWQLDPAGCKPSVVQKVADGMGLAVKEKDKPGPARLRGVSWGDHLRAALRMIPFGFSPFELEADTSDGKTAKLHGVWERPPWTIANIHVDGKTGLLLGADQDGLTRKDQPQIPADRMAWYVRGREGANWAGTSLFRPCYASWLLKEEVRRYHGAANVRWSMGVPVMEALPGTNPTSTQMAEAMQMAAAARGGIQAGAASPPGFALKIMGISGSLPNSQEFLQYLDQQMSSSALLGVLDLGDTANGSRALGDVFIDVFHLALEAEGELVADIATRQIAARIVDWNFGPDENVPRVVVSGVGSRREVTAESLQMLLGSGALAPYPELVEWVCREYRLPLPERMPPLKTAAPGVDLPKPDSPPDQPAEGSPGPATVKAAAGQPVEPDYQHLEDQHAQAVTDMTQQWQQQSSPLVEAVVAATAAELAAGTLVGLAALAVPPAVVSGLATGIGKTMLGVAAASALVAAGDLAKAGVTVAGSLPKTSRDVIRRQAQTTAALLVNGYASAAGREALRLTGPDSDPDKVAAAVRAVLTDVSTAKTQGLVAGAVSAAASTAQAEGRRAVFARLPDGTRFQASERLDDGNQCQPCRDINGHVYASLGEALADYPVNGYKACLGRDRCRGQLVAVLPA